MLFPSFLSHTVPMRHAAPDGAPRISVAFNLWFEGDGMDRRAPHHAPANLGAQAGTSAVVPACVCASRPRARRVERTAECAGFHACRYSGAETEAGMRDQPGKHQYFAMSDTVLDAEYVPRQGYSPAMSPWQ